MKGAEAVVQCLIREGVDVIFAYPGGASQELHQALARTDKIRVILPRHEQGGSFAAGGYARASGKVGVCMATSGPGATNLASAIADAFMDSIPLVAITGQVYSKYIGKMAFQETDFFGMTLPVVKHSYLVLDVHDLPRIFKEAFHIARSGRPGPVVIDIPKDVQQARFQPVYPPTVEFRNPTVNSDYKAGDESLKEVIGLVAEAKRPAIYAGGGIISSGAHAELRAFAIKANIPVATTLMGVGGLSGDPSPVDAVVWHARERLRKLGRGRMRPAARPGGPLRRPDNGRHAEVRRRGQRSSTWTSTPRSTTRTSASSTRSKAT